MFKVGDQVKIVDYTGLLLWSPSVGLMRNSEVKFDKLCPPGTLTVAENDLKIPVLHGRQVYADLALVDESGYTYYTTSCCCEKVRELVTFREAFEDMRKNEVFYFNRKLGEYYGVMNNNLCVSLYKDIRSTGTNVLSTYIVKYTLSDEKIWEKVE